MDANPPLPGALLLKTQLELIGTTTAAGALYGIAFVLYCLYLHASFPLSPDYSRRQAQFMITCSTIIMICALYVLVSYAWVIQDAYIKHSNFPGGPLVYENSTFLTQPVIASIVCQSAVDILTAAIPIWRLWVIWSGTGYARLVVIPPLLSLAGFTALRISVVFVQFPVFNSNLAESQGLKLGTAAFALRVAAAILPTFLIAGFLVFQSRRQCKLIGQAEASSLYIKVVVMLVESYALESTWIIAFVILYSIPHPLEQFFNDTLPYVEVIAYLLVLYRVANRRTYGSKRVHGSSSGRDNVTSSLHWGHTTMQSGVASVADTNTHLSGIQPEPDTLQEHGSQA